MRVLRRLLPLSVALAGLLAAPSGAAGAPLQPGAYHETSVGACTLNFVYDGGGSTYLGTAAHCVGDVGQAVRDDAGKVFGRVALVGDQDSTARDWALIRVNAADLGRVSPVVKGYPGTPTGVTRPGETASGDGVDISGYGMGFDVTPFTREARFGLLMNDTTERYELVGPTIYGDSGGPLVHLPSGQALGIVSRLCLGRVCTDEGPTVQGILKAAAARGLKLSLRRA